MSILSRLLRRFFGVVEEAVEDIWHSPAMTDARHQFERSLETMIETTISQALVGKDAAAVCRWWRDKKREIDAKLAPICAAAGESID